MIRVARSCVIVVTLAWLTALTTAQEEVKPKKSMRRFGFDVDQEIYPQKTYQEALKSIAVALDRKKTDYLLAQLIDPKYVDYWIDRYKTDFPQGSEPAKILLAFDRLLNETNQYFQDDPVIQRELRIFSREAEWTENEDVAVGTVKTIPARKVFLRRIDDRWFLENRQQEGAQK